MLAVGETLQGRYRILREIGVGGMGTVYEGENLLIRRRVAIKVMREEIVDRPDLCARFELEAQIASQIPSDHITEVLDLGELEGGRRFIVMEYLVGESLSARLEGVQRLEPRELLGLVRQVLLALGAAHRAGVIHRDVKPENVFILGEKAGRRDFVKLLDFGVSKLRPTGTEIPLTQSGVFVGTPSYMAPEQIGGLPPSPLSDLYAVGVILYRGLTGEAPFQSQGVHDLVYKVALGTFVRPIERVAGLDPALDELVCKAMARFPDQRFQSAEEFIAALDGWLAGSAESVPEVSAVRTPPRAPGGAVTPARVATPLVEPVVTASVPFFTSPGLSVSTRRPTPKWLGWAALGALVLVAGGLLAFWRSARDVEGSAPRVEVQAVEPAPPAAAAAAPAAVAAPAAAAAAAPVAAAATAPAAGPAPAVARVVAVPVPAAEPAAVEPHSAAAATMSKSASLALHAPSRAKPPRSVAASHAPEVASHPPVEPAHAPVEPSSHSDDSSSKPRPDWGY